MTINIQYPVNEVFATLQGEATFAGVPSVFIRLQGCNVGCGWCDTRHTWGLEEAQKVNFNEIIDKTDDKISWANVTINQLVEHIQKNYSQITHIVITGGEPAQYDLQPLCARLEELGKDVQIETSGTEALRITLGAWVTLSPKIDMPGGKRVLEDSWLRANELKMPVGKISDIVLLKSFIQQYEITNRIPIWVQPLSQNPTATRICIEEALRNNWKLSIQIHKYLNIR